MSKIDKKTGRFLRENPKEYLYRNIVITETGCWDWIGTLNAQGYGVFKNKIMSELLGHKVAVAASRASWVIHYGWIERTDWVLHKCDNPACCNPAHLFIGTPQDNVDDMVSKGRNSRGEDRPASKLKEADIRRIRELRGKRGDPNRVKVKDLAALFDVSHHTIRHVIYGESWTHVED